MADQAAFIARYHEVVDDLDRNGRSDNETMWLLGSLVARLVTGSDADNWIHFKQILDDKSLTELVDTLDRNAATYQAEGKTKAAYVARLLGISLVAGRVPDPELRKRDTLLDGFISTAAVVYIQQHTAKQPPPAG
ncbi:MAG: hypothetical protein EOP22_19140 [Hyphomicrobiales bacterium]|nr:MAG: hypothetical protein EOP22_19140 [Hyphomicrobiales bacterium]